MDLVFGLGLAADLLTDSVAAGPPAGPLNGAEVRLFQNNIIPSPNSVVGDFTVCDYTGYADEAIAWNAVSNDDEGNPEIVGIVGEFRPADAVTPNLVYGMIILDSGGAYLAGGLFEDGPLPMEDALDAIVVTPRVRMTSSGIVAVVS